MAGSKKNSLPVPVRKITKLLNLQAEFDRLEKNFNDELCSDRKYFLKRMVLVGEELIKTAQEKYNESDNEYYIVILINARLHDAFCHLTCVYDEDFEDFEKDNYIKDCYDYENKTLDEIDRHVSSHADLAECWVVPRLYFLHSHFC